MYAISLDKVERETKNAGRKASNLGELIKLGLNVPEGFVLTSDAFDLFLKENELSKKIGSALSQIDFNDVSSIKKASSGIQNAILNGNMPRKVEQSIKEAYEELSVGREVKKVGGFALDLVKAGRETVVCVRPSPFADDSLSFAGQMRAEMNVKGNGRIINTVKKVWASLYTPGAIFYRKEKGMDNMPSTAVIIQKMVNADKSGVIFSVDPAEGDQSKIVIEAGFGLGDPVVSGLIRPDAYIIEKSEGNILKKTINKKLWEKRVDKSTGNVIMERLPESRMNMPVLSESDVKTLLDTTMKIEGHFKFPQNIEWCKERGRIFIVQSRAVTGLNSKEAAGRDGDQKEGESVVKGIHAFPSRARGNVRVISNQTDLDMVTENDILLSKFFSLEMVPYLRKVRAVITDEGGITSIPSILAREFDVPLLFGAASAVSALKSGQGITIGSDGGVYCTRSGIEAGLQKPEPGQENVPGFGESPEIPSQQSIGGGGNSDLLDTRFTATEIMLRLSSPQVDETFRDKADGVGILRLEDVLTEGGKNPVAMAKENPSELVNIIAEAVGKVARTFHPRPVWYRSLEMGDESGRNPIIGVRGFRFSFLNPDVFRCEIEALKNLYNSGLDNIGLLLPFVSAVGEFRKAKEVIGFNIKLGVSIETPASALSIEEFCKEGVAFVSVDLDTLSQLVLGVEKNHPKVSYLYSQTSRPVMDLIAKVYGVCRKHNVMVSVTGESIADPAVAEAIIESGADSISVAPEAIEPARTSVAKAERRILLKKLRGR
jgi:pyruvate,water dikinase